jgi:hypothetical protein
MAQRVGRKLRLEPKFNNNNNGLVIRTQDLRVNYNDMKNNFLEAIF